MYQEENGGHPYLELRKMRHPCVSQNCSTFIPNDTIIGKLEGDTKNKTDPSLILVTGPNMGGKSTLLRQTCLAVLLAQIGCFVTAEKCHMTVFDRVFTRIGASDRILEGKSTFFVEMEETKNIVEHATKYSLAIVDELGRGTSTFDGYAIAQAVLKYLVSDIKCLSLFSTHYHMLVEEFRATKEVALYHMACNVDPKSEHVTFLYKFQLGECPKSYGINVARLAGLPDKVLNNAKIMAEAFSKKLSFLAQKVRALKIPEEEIVV